MILLDVSVLLNAYTVNTPHHGVCRAAVQRALAAPGPIGINSRLFASVVRIGTNPRLFKPAPTPVEVFEYLEVVRCAATAVACEPGQKHWRLFRDLVEGAGLVGGDVSDAWFAALALEHGSEWWTTDSDFQRFPGLRYTNLLHQA